MTLAVSLERPSNSICIKPYIDALSKELAPKEELVAGMMDKYWGEGRESNVPPLATLLRALFINPFSLDLLARWEKADPGKAVEILTPLWFGFKSLLSGYGLLGVVEGTSSHTIGGDCCNPLQTINQYMTKRSEGGVEWRISNVSSSRTPAQRFWGVGDDEFGSSCC